MRELDARNLIEVRTQFSKLVDNLFKKGVEKTEIQNLIKIFELITNQKYPLNKCPQCSCDFVPRLHAGRVYCSEKCLKNFNKDREKLKIESDKFYAIYKPVYKTMYTRISAKKKKISKQNFNIWMYHAKEYMEYYRNVEDGLNKYKQWLEESKKLGEKSND